MTRILRIDGNPEGHSSTVDIFLFPIRKIHWNIKSIINVLLKPAIREIENKISGKRLTKTLHEITLTKLFHYC